MQLRNTLKKKKASLSHLGGNTKKKYLDVGPETLTLTVVGLMPNIYPAFHIACNQVSLKSLWLTSKMGRELITQIGSIFHLYIGILVISKNSVQKK